VIQDPGGGWWSEDRQWRWDGRAWHPAGAGRHEPPPLEGLHLGTVEEGYRASGDKRSADGIRELGPLLEPGESLVAIANGVDHDQGNENRVHCLLVATDRRVLQLGLASGLNARMIRRHIWTFRSSPYPTITRYHAQHNKGVFGGPLGQGWILYLTLDSNKPVTRWHPAPSISTAEIPAQMFPGLQQAILNRLLPAVRQEAINHVAAEHGKHSP
jgi:hypothetical protein